MDTFVVERYWPGVSAGVALAALDREAEAARAMTSEGRRVRILRSTLIEEDETLLSIVQAQAKADVVELGVRAGRPADRIVAARDLRADEDEAPRA